MWPSVLQVAQGKLCRPNVVGKKVVFMVFFGHLNQTIIPVETLFQPKIKQIYSKVSLLHTKKHKYLNFSVY